MNFSSLFSGRVTAFSRILFPAPLSIRCVYGTVYSNRDTSYSSYPLPIRKIGTSTIFLSAQV